MSIFARSCCALRARTQDQYHFRGVKFLIFWEKCVVGLMMQGFFMIHFFNFLKHSRQGNQGRLATGGNFILYFFFFYH